MEQFELTLWQKIIFATMFVDSIFNRCYAVPNEDTNLAVHPGTDFPVGWIDVNWMN